MFDVCKRVFTVWQCIVFSISIDKLEETSLLAMITELCQASLSLDLMSE